MSAEARFWPKVDKSEGCWLWRGSLNNKGYGQFYLRRATYVLAHRYAYELLVGPIGDGMVIMHRCDTPACVRPDHLRQATMAENQADMARKGRAGHRGERSTQARLTEAQVREIRQRADAGEPHRLIARDFSVSRGLVSGIARGDRWAHVA